VAAAVLAACGSGDLSPESGGADSLAAGEISWTTDSSIAVQQLPPSQFPVDTVARSMEVPWAGVITPSGDLFFTERNGRIRILRNDSLIARPLATLEIRRFDEDWKPENGLTGITLSPDFATSGHVFVLAAYEWRRSAIGRLLYSRVVGSVSGLFRAQVWEYETRLV
jgi:glucose/arabinose dehydrogenase